MKLRISGTALLFPLRAFKVFTQTTLPTSQRKSLSISLIGHYSCKLPKLNTGFCVCVVRGPRSRCYGRTTALRLIVQPLWWRSAVSYQVLQLMEHQWNEIDRGKPTTRRKTCLSATLSTANLTWTDLGSNPGLRGERPATDRLSHGTARTNGCQATWPSRAEIAVAQ
jgi:hypothetical protein